MNKDDKNLYFSFHELFREEGKTCARQGELFEYFQNLLGEEDRQKFERHLTSCSICPSRLAELQETATAATSLVLDSSVAEKILEQNRTKLESSLDEMQNEGGDSKDSRKMAERFFKMFSFPGYANALVIALLLVLLYPAYQGFVLKNDMDRLQNELQSEKSKARVAPDDLARMKEAYEKQIQSMKQERSTSIEPTLSPTAVFAIREQRAGQLETIPLNFNERQKSYNLVFSVPANNSKSTRVEILEDGKSIWKGMVIPSTVDSTSSLISVNLPAEYLKGTSYRLVISRIGKEGSNPVAEYKLKVTHDR